MPDPIVHYLVQIILNMNVKDVCTWKGCTDGVPTTRSFFKFLSRDESNFSFSRWEWICKLYCPQKLRFFVWLLVHDRLPVNAYRKHIGSSDSDLCDHCGTYSETVLYMVRD